jgi:hypothetical protein
MIELSRDPSILIQISEKLVWFMSVNLNEKKVDSLGFVAGMINNTGILQINYNFLD